ncbi:MAG: sigma-70 family RNA polymerase sigma factor [Mycobacterium leprae]
MHHQLAAKAPGALDQLMAEHIDAVHRLVTLIIGAAGSPEDVEESVADAFTRAWHEAHRFDPSRSTLRSWLLMIAKYTALDHRRQLLRGRYGEGGEVRQIALEAAPDPADGTTPEAEALRSERSERLHHALEQLPAADRDLLIRRYFFDQSIAEIARELGLTRTAADNRLWRARQALRNALTAMGEVQADV